MSATAADPGASAQGQGGAANGATNGAAQGGTGAKWYEGLPPEDRGLAELKGWAEPGHAVRDYRNLEKFHGVPPSRLLKLPDKDDSPDWGEVYGKLGRPEKSDGYGIEGLPPELAEALHKQGLSTRQVKNLYGVLAEQAKASKAAEESSSNEKLQASVAALKAEWGKEYEPNAAAVDRAVAHMGMEEADLLALRGAWGFEKAMKFFARIGRGLGEDEFVGGDNAAAGAAGGFGLTPEAAGAKVKQLQGDPEFLKRYHSPNKDTRIAAAQELQSLLNTAYPGETMASKTS